MLTRLFAALMTVIVCFGASSAYTELPKKPSPQRMETTVIKTDTPAAQETSSAERVTAAETNLDASRAEEIALQALGLTRAEVRFDRTELDYERGIWVWEVEFRHEKTEYDFVIHAESGEILRTEQETDRRPATPELDISVPEPAEITQDKAVEIALAHAGLTQDQVTRLNVEKDRDDSVWVYEIDFRDRNTEYDYEIRVSDGKIVDYDKEYD